VDQDSGANELEVAAAYDRPVGRYGERLAAGLIEAAELAAGMRVLDLGCGTGQLTRRLAALLGEDRVTAIDPSEEFVRCCRARVPGADVRVGVGERLPFPDGEFDGVLSQLVVPLLSDREAGVSEMARVTRAGGVVAACVWDAARMPLLQAFWDAALAVAPERAGAFGEGGRVGYRSADVLALAWGEAGLGSIATGELEVSAEYESFDDLFAPFTAGSGNSGSVYRGLDDGGRERVRAHAFEALGAPPGAFELTAHAWWVRGRR
jgi:SAM-dependent methyltransferase